MAKGKGTAELTALTEEITSAMGAARPRERPMPAPTQLANFSVDYRNTVAELERVKKDQGTGFEVALTQLRTSPFQVGGINLARAQALADNLRNNPQSTPIVVRASTEAGFFELVAGHHRVHAFQLLNRTHIRAVLVLLTDDEAERVVFYDNLLAPSLTDYEKYCGFAQRRQSRGLSQESLAKEAGVDQSHISGLFAFERLPAEAQALIKASPAQATARLFRTLAPFADSQPEKVVAAVERVLAGRLAITGVPAFIKGRSASAPAASDRTVIRKGKRVFAEVRRRAGQVVVSMADESDAPGISEAIEALIRARAEG